MNCPARDCGALAAASTSRSGFRPPRRTVESTGLPRPETPLRDLRGALRMPFSHFRGTGRGGFNPPVDSTGRGGFIPPVDSTGRDGFIPPVDALRHVRSRKPLGICSCEKCVRNSSGMCSYKSLDLNFFGISSYKKHRGVPPSCFLASVAFSHSQRRGTPCLEYLRR